MVAGEVGRIDLGTHRFYVTMSVVMMAVAFTGFAPSYWVPMINGSLRVAPIFHLHGAVFFAWSLFLVLQASLVATGRTVRHREMGMAGIALATAMVLTGLAAAARGANDGLALGSELALPFTVVPLTGIVFFAVLFGYAVANVKRPDVHKRAILLASVSILQAAVGRWFQLFLAAPGAVGPPTVATTIAPGLVSDLLLVALVVHDRRTRGRVHPVYVVGGIALVALQLLRVPLGTTSFWLAIAGWFAGLAA